MPPEHRSLIAWCVAALSLAASLALAGSAQAATYHVDRSRGSDEHKCSQTRRARTPKITINAGLECLSGGDTLRIGPGTYAERIGGGAIPPGQGEHARTTIAAADPGTVILKPSGRGHIITLGQDAAYITLEGLVLDGEGLSGGGEYAALKVEGDGRGPDGPAHHITLRSMVLENIPHDTCAQVTGSHHVWSHVRVRNCQGQESGTGSHGIYWQVRDGLIENIEVSQVSGLGIQLYYAKGSN